MKFKQETSDLRVLFNTHGCRRSGLWFAASHVWPPWGGAILPGRPAPQRLHVGVMWNSSKWEEGFWWSCFSWLTALIFRCERAAADASRASIWNVTFLSPVAMKVRRLQNTATTMWIKHNLMVCTTENNYDNRTLYYFIKYAKLGFLPMCELLEEVRG